MIMRYKLWAAIILASWGLEGCGHEPVAIPDAEFCGWVGAAGGPGKACACAHSVFTTIPVAHYDLNTCITKLQGAVFLQGAIFNTIQANVDTLCAETGVCTYQQQQAVNQMRLVLAQIHKIIPKP